MVGLFGKGASHNRNIDSTDPLIQTVAHSLASRLNSTDLATVLTLNSRFSDSDTHEIQQAMDTTTPTTNYRPGA